MVQVVDRGGAYTGRVPVEMVVGKESIWIKLDNIEGPILDPADMTAPPYDAMTPEERTEASLQMLEPPKPAPATRAPAPAPVVYEKPGDPSRARPLGFKGDPPPRPRPRPTGARGARGLGRRWRPSTPPAALLHLLRLRGPRCVQVPPCGFYRGTFCFPPRAAIPSWAASWRLSSGVDRRPRSPYVRAGVAPDAEPESKYAVDPARARHDARRGARPEPVAEVCPKYPQSTAARLVAYVLGKVDHVTQGVESDFRYYLRTNEDWQDARADHRDPRGRRGERGRGAARGVPRRHQGVRDGGEPTGVPAGRLGRHEAARQGAPEEGGARGAQYPDSDADEEDVAAYLEAKLALDRGA